MKTPEEIKKGLALCVSAGSYNYPCDECPYANEEDGCKNMMEDALAYIRQLDADNAKKGETIQMLQDGNASLMDMVDEECEKSVRFELERDAALHDMKNINGNICLACKNHYRPDLSVLKFACKEFGDLRCQEVLHCGKFEWRGVQEEKENEKKTD